MTAKPPDDVRKLLYGIAGGKSAPPSAAGPAGNVAMSAYPMTIGDRRTLIRLALRCKSGKAAQDELVAFVEHWAEDLVSGRDVRYWHGFDQGFAQGFERRVAADDSIPTLTNRIDPDKERESLRLREACGFDDPAREAYLRGCTSVAIQPSPELEAALREAEGRIYGPIIRYTLRERVVRWFQQSIAKAAR